MKVKIILQITLLLILVSTIAHYLITSKNGFLRSWQLKQEVISEKEKVTNLEKKVAELEAIIKAWQNSPFEKERLAREDLMMSNTHEYVYFRHFPAA